MGRTGNDPRNRRFVTILVICLAATGFCVGHWKTLWCGFLSDDFVLLSKTFSPSGYHIFRTIILEKDEPVYYRPLFSLAYMLDSVMWGPNPMGFHISNCLLHAANAFLAYVLALALLGTHSGALLTAAFFMIFPLQPEAVTWIAGRGDLLATFFSLCSMVFYIRYKDARYLRFFFLSVVSGMLGILSKEHALGFPLMLIAMEGIALRNTASATRRRLNPIGAIFLASIIPLYFCTRLLLLSDELRGSMMDMIRPRIPESSSIVVVLGLLGHMVLNCTLRPLRTVAAPFNHYQANAGVYSAVYALLVAVFLLIGIRSGTYRNRVACFSVVGFVVSLVPVAPIFNVAPDLQNARFLYLPSFFVCLFLANLVFGTPRNETGACGMFFRCFLIAVLGTVMTAGLRDNNEPWIEAGRITRKVVEEFKRLSTDLRWPCRILMDGLPDNHLGAYVFRNGIAQALNLSVGCLPPFRYVPSMKKVTYEYYYMIETLPLKVVTPDLVHQWRTLQPVFSALNFELPVWLTPDPAGYDYCMLWDSSRGSFEVCSGTVQRPLSVERAQISRPLR